MLSNRLTHEQRQQWADRVESWRTSGKSVAEWCREHEVVYHKFLYWKDRFSQKKEKRSNSITTAFVEIPEDKTDRAGISLEYQGLRIRLSKRFDHSTLQSLIILLRSL